MLRLKNVLKMFEDLQAVFSVDLAVSKPDPKSSETVGASWLQLRKRFIIKQFAHRLKS